MGVGAAAVDRLAVLACAARRPRRASATALQRAVDRGQPDRRRRAARAGRGSPARERKSSTPASASSDGLPLPGRARGPRRPGSVLVIVRPLRCVDGVPVAVVDVVDVVAVLDREVAAVRAVLVRWCSSAVCVCQRAASRLANGAGSRAGAAQPARRRGQVATKPASDEQHDRRRPGRRWRGTTRRRRAPARRATASDAERPSPPSSVVRNDRVNCCDVATGTTISARDQQQADRAHRHGDA